MNVFSVAAEMAVRRRLMKAVFFFSVESSDLDTGKRSKGRDTSS